MQELEVKWHHVFSIIWLLFWRGCAIGAGVGLVIGLGIGVVGAITGHPGITPLEHALVILAVLPTYPFVVRMALRKKYKSFRIALVANAPVAPAMPEA